MSFKAWMFTAGDVEPSTNGLAFETAEQAESYALDLSMRWTAVRDYEVRPSDEAVNARIAEGRLEHLRADVVREMDHS